MKAVLLLVAIVHAGCCGSGASVRTLELSAVSARRAREDMVEDVERALARAHLAWSVPGYFGTFGDTVRLVFGVPMRLRLIHSDGLGLMLVGWSYWNVPLEWNYACCRDH